MRRVTGLVFLAAALMVSAILLLIVLPTWVRPDWLGPLTIAVIALFAVAVFGGAAFLRAHPRQAARAGTTRARSGDFSLAPRGMTIALAVLVYVAALIVVIVVGQQVVAAHALGAHPARAVAISVDDGNCSRCASDVTFAVGDHEYRASLSGNIDGGLHPGVELVYDPSDPYRVMTLSDWQSGRTGGAPYALVGAPILVVLTTAGLWGLAYLRRRRFGRLKPATSIESVRCAAAARGRRTTRTWLVSFADGTRARYIDSPRLRAALSERITATPIAITAEDRALLTPGPIQYPPSGYLPASYPPDYPLDGGYSPYPPGFGAHEARPRRTRTIRAIRSISLALTTIAIIGALVLGLHHGKSGTSGGGVVGTVAAGSGDPATDDDCLDGPTLGPSAAATAYLNAVAAAMPEWLRVDANLAAQGGVIHARDIAGELSADTTFLAQLRPIQFPATVTATDQQLVTSVQAYDAVLTSAENHNGYLTANRDRETQILQERAQSSGQLRQVLGLPPSQCTLLRP